MAETQKRTFVVAMLAALAVAGCSYNNVFEVDDGESFLGLEQLINSNTGPSNARQLNVVFVHGMGHHPFGEIGIRNYQKRIAKELYFAPEDVQSVDWGNLCPPAEKRVNFDLLLKREGTSGYITEREVLEELKAEKQEVCPLRINQVIVGYVGWRQYRNMDASGSRVLNLFELSWDRATELLQKTILELDENYNETIELDEDLKPYIGKDRETDRAYGNRWLKKFVNRQLGDPVVYLGNYGDSIRQTVAEGLLKIASLEGTNPGSPYTIISDSLGSRIVFDTLNCVLGPSRQTGCKASYASAKRAEDGIEKLNQLAKNTFQVFMNANQLPFLAMSTATAPKPEDKKEEDWLNRLPCDCVMPRLKYSERPTEVRVVAFTDPNDALSYHLTKRFKEKCSRLAGPKKSDIHFINVRITNAKWNYFFVIADPLKAHSTGFRENDKAIELLIHGYEADKVQIRPY